MTTLPDVIAGAGADVVVTGNFRAVAPAGMYGTKPATTTGLTWGYFGGIFGPGTSISDGTVVCGASTTTYVVASRSTGAVSSATNTTNWNDDTNYFRLAALTTNGSGITAIVDHRPSIYNSAGGGGGSGTVTSVAYSFDSSLADLFSIGGSPVTTSGTLTASAVDPGADRIAFWDDSAGKLTYLQLGTNLSISGTTLNATGTVADGDKGDITVSSSGATWTIDSQAVTYAKLQNISAQYRLLGRNSASAGSAEEVTLSQLLDWVGSAANGDILMRSGGSWTRLPIGTNGQVLTVASNLPSWSAAGSGGVTIGASLTDVLSGTTTLAAVDAGSVDKLVGWDDSASKQTYFQPTYGLKTNGTDLRGALQTLAIACSDLVTNISAGTGKAYFYVPYDFTVVEVQASLDTVQTAGSIFTVDINESGTTILSTKLTIDNNEGSSITAATPPVISDSSLTKGNKITVDVDQIGTAGARGLIVYIIGYPT